MPSLRRLPTLLLSLFPLLLWGCGEESGPAQTPPPPEHLVVAEEVAYRPVSAVHERTGTLRARRLVRIYNREEGRITSLPYFEGDTVSEGELLLSLDDELLKAELAKAEANTAQARQDYSRLSNLATRKAVSRDELSRAKTQLEVSKAEQNLLQTRLGHTRISAPFDGVISARHAEPGDVVSKHTHILTLSDPGSLVTQIHISELLLPHLKIDDPVQVRIDALGNEKYPGRILRIHPELEPVTRQGIVEVILKPVPEGARAGQFARVTLETAQVERLMIPFSAVRHDKEGPFVYLLNAEQKVERRTVRSGIRIAHRVEILQGLEPGQQVITRGFLGLAEGKVVKRVTP
jgi:RND family efflux transporter MFP subunit